MSNSSQQTSATHQFVVFGLGGEQYALPIAQIQEVIRYTQPRAIASDLAGVTGVISLRGKIVPVGDFAARLGVQPTEPSEDSKIVIIETSSQTAGMIVDAVDEVLTINDDDLDPTGVAAGDIVRGIAKLDQRLVVVLDTAALLPSLPAAA